MLIDMFASKQNRLMRASGSLDRHTFQLVECGSTPRKAHAALRNWFFSS